MESQTIIMQNRDALREHENTDLLKVAFDYRNKRLSVIAVRNNKTPVTPWKEDQVSLQNDEKLISSFSNKNAQGIGIVCGKVSGNLEVIDVDAKNDKKGKLVHRLKKAIERDIPALWNRLFLVATPTRGLHIYYFCSTIEGNQKLARTRIKRENSDDAFEQPVIIETRGEGGYVLAPPTKGYELVGCVEIPLITEEERDALLSVCRSFDETIEEIGVKNVFEKSNNEFLVTPYQDFNKRGDVVKLLQKHQWRVVGHDHERTFFCRPGKSSGVSADFHHDYNLFKCFTTSTHFEANKGYKPGQVYAVLECGNDFNKVQSKLFNEGYGISIDKDLGDIIDEVTKRRCKTKIRYN